MLRYYPPSGSGQGISEKCELIIVIGSKKSSNSNRLCETAEHCGVKAILIDSPEDINIEDLPKQVTSDLQPGLPPLMPVQDTIEFLKKYNYKFEKLFIISL